MSKHCVLVLANVRERLRAVPRVISEGLSMLGVFHSSPPPLVLVVVVSQLLVVVGMVQGA